MSFPYDARYSTFAANMQVPSAYLNDSQDGILGSGWGASATVHPNGYASKYGTRRADYVCTGANDEVTIQAAIDWVNSVGGGTVILAEGVYVIEATIDIKDKTSIMGMGREATVLQVPAAVAADVDPVLSGNAVGGFSISKLQVDCNGANIAGAYHVNGIYITGAAAEQSLLREVWVDDAEVDAGSGGEGIRVDGDNVVLVDCYVDGSDTAGIVLAGTRLVAHRCYTSGNAQGFDISSVSAHLADCISHEDTAGFTIDDTGHRLVNCRAEDCLGGDGFVLNTTERAVLIACAATSCVSGDGFSSTAPVKCVLLGCEAYFNDNHGISLEDGDDCRIEACQVHENSQGTTNTSDGIYCIDGNNSAIVNNTVREPGAGNRQKYGLEFANAPNAPTAFVVHGNDLRNSGQTGNFVDPAGAALTIPEWTWSGAAHVQNSVQYTNRI